MYRGFLPTSSNQKNKKSPPPWRRIFVNSTVIRLVEVKELNTVEERLVKHLRSRGCVGPFGIPKVTRENHRNPGGNPGGNAKNGTLPICLSLFVFKLNVYLYTCIQSQRNYRMHVSIHERFPLVEHLLSKSPNQNQLNKKTSYESELGDYLSCFHDTKMSQEVSKWLATEGITGITHF